jgi:predicted amino acid dehydrogenase
MMRTYAFMIHPIEPQRDVARKFPILGKLPCGVIDRLCRYFPPVYVSQIAGVRSEASGEEIEGWLVACPLTPKAMLEVPVSTAYRKIIETGRLAERLGARILGLGAFTSVVGDAGVTVSRSLGVPVTTGISYTIAIAVEAALEAARGKGLDPGACTAVVVGAYGATGRACAQLLARSVPRLLLVGRKRDRLREAQRHVEAAAAGVRTQITTDLSRVCEADIVLTVTSAVEPIIEAEHLKPGAVVCDVARPRNVSRRVVEERDDVVVLEGGVVELPGEAGFGFDFGLPAGRAYACMAETMILALEGRNECYSLGRNVSLERVDEMARLAAKHGFRLSGLRRSERVAARTGLARIGDRAPEACPG